MAAPLPPEVPAPRTSLVTETGAMKEGVPSLIAIAFGVGIAAFGIGWAIVNIIVTKAHSTADDILTGSCLLVAFACVLPANLEKAVAAIKPVIPWGKRDNS